MLFYLTSVKKMLNMCKAGKVVFWEIMDSSRQNLNAADLKYYDIIIGGGGVYASSIAGLPAPTMILRKKDKK